MQPYLYVWIYLSGYSAAPFGPSLNPIQAFMVVMQEQVDKVAGRTSRDAS